MKQTYLVGYGPFLVYSSAPLLGTAVTQRQKQQLILEKKIGEYLTTLNSL